MFSSLNNGYIFFKLITSFVFKSLSALLNISNDTGLGMTSFGGSFGSGSRWMDSSIVLVKGVVVAT